MATRTARPLPKDRARRPDGGLKISSRLPFASAQGQFSDRKASHILMALNNSYVFGPDIPAFPMSAITNV